MLPIAAATAPNVPAVAIVAATPPIAVATPAVPVDLRAAAPGAQTAGDFLGFEIGEERHYRLGPAESLERGEAATWIIRLESVEGGGTERRGTFSLQHRREAPRSIENPPLPGQVTIAQVDTTLVVNAYGAPLELSYFSTRHVYDLGDEVFQVDYRYDGDRYQKRVELMGYDWDFHVDLIQHANLDADVPIGLFAFAPSALECLEWLAGTRIQQRTGTGDTGPPTLADDPEGASARVEDAALASGSCADANADPAFSNPGLVSLAMPLLWEQRGDSELVLFSPLRPDLVRGQDIGVPVTFSPIVPGVGGVPGSSILSGVIPGLDFRAMLGGGGTDGDEERAKDPDRHFFPHHLKLSDRQRIEVGSRKMEALPLQISRFAGTVWVDDWGKVVRIDTPPWRFGDPERWIRLLHASER